MVKGVFRVKSDTFCVIDIRSAPRDLAGKPVVVEMEDALAETLAIDLCVLQPVGALKTRSAGMARRVHFIVHTPLAAGVGWSLISAG